MERSISNARTFESKSVDERRLIASVSNDSRDDSRLSERLGTDTVIVQAVILGT